MYCIVLYCISTLKYIDIFSSQHRVIRSFATSPGVTHESHMRHDIIIFLKINFIFQYASVVCVRVLSI